MLIRVLRAHLRPYKRWLYLLLLLHAGQATASLLLPTLNADILDRGVLRGDNGYVWSTGSIMLVVTLIQLSLAGAGVYCAGRVAMGFGRDVRAALFHRVTDFSAREVNLFGAPSLITRITNDVQQVQMLVVMIASMALTAPLTIVFGAGMAMRQDIGMSWLLAASLPVLVVVLGTIVAKMLPQFRHMQEHLDRMNGVLRQQIVGMRVVRAFVREPVETERFNAVNGDLTHASLAAGRLMSLMFPTMIFIVNASSVLILWVGAPRIQSGDMTIGSLVAFLTYLTLMMMAIMMATFSVLMIPRAAVSAERIQAVLGTESSVRAADDPATTLRGKGTLEMRAVGFKYPGAEHAVLDNISFKSGPGETTAIIGSTGSGKTSLINLVARLFDVTEGAVLIDGVDVRKIEPTLLWHRIGLVPQKPYLFSGTVASNLRYGKPDATDEEIWEALEVAQATDFVRALPLGIGNVVVQGGANLSGGQRQRLAMARALVRKPEIYLFDDSFSALDIATDARLRAALEPYTEGATVIVVAQRVSTIANADRIIVLEDGEIVGVGRHHELIDTCPTYAEIVQSQLGVEEAA